MEDHSLCQQSRYCAFPWEGQSTEERKKAKRSSHPNLGHTHWTSTYLEVVWALITYAELWEVRQGCHQPDRPCLFWRRVGEGKKKQLKAILPRASEEAKVLHWQDPEGPVCYDRFWVLQFCEVWVQYSLAGPLSSAPHCWAIFHFSYVLLTAASALSLRRDASNGVRSWRFIQY